MEPSKVLPNSVGQAIISNSVSFLSLMQCIGENCTFVTALAYLEYPHIIHADEDGHPGPNYRYIPSEKIGQNVHPSESSFFVINYQHWAGRSAFRPFLALPDHWGGLGGPGGGVGGPADPKNDIIAQRPNFALECMVLGCNN